MVEKLLRQRLSQSPLNPLKLLTQSPLKRPEASRSSAVCWILLIVMDFDVNDPEV